MRFIQVDTNINVQPFANFAKTHLLINDEIDVIFSTIEHKQKVAVLLNLSTEEFMGCYLPARRIIHIFVEPFHNNEHLLYIFIHEITHHIIEKNLLLKNHFNNLTKEYNTRKNVETLSDQLNDEFHINDPEELFCDSVAKEFVKTEIGRSWWRKMKIELKNINSDLIVNKE